MRGDWNEWEEGEAFRARVERWRNAFYAYALIAIPAGGVCFLLMDYGNPSLREWVGILGLVVLPCWGAAIWMLRRWRIWPFSH